MRGSAFRREETRESARIFIAGGRGMAGPDQLRVWRTFANRGEQFGKIFAILVLAVIPAVHADIELHSAPSTMALWGQASGLAEWRLATPGDEAAHNASACRGELT